MPHRRAQSISVRTRRRSTAWSSTKLSRKVSRNPGTWGSGDTAGVTAGVGGATSHSGIEANHGGSSDGAGGVPAAALAMAASTAQNAMARLRRVSPAGRRRRARARKAHHERTRRMPADTALMRGSRPVAHDALIAARYLADDGRAMDNATDLRRLCGIAPRFATERPMYGRVRSACRLVRDGFRSGAAVAGSRVDSRTCPAISRRLPVVAGTGRRSGRRDITVHGQDAHVRRPGPIARAV